MKTKLIKVVLITLALILATLDPAAAQNASTNSSNSTGSATRTDRSIEYHNGGVLDGPTQIVYFIWYGCWGMSFCGMYDQADTIFILSDFMSNLGSTPYFQINRGYPNSSGQVPSGDLAFGGSANDAYSHGPTLTEADVADVVANQVSTGGLLLDPSGIYIVLTSADVTVVDTATQFCSTYCNLHGHSVVVGSAFRYGFVGNPARCPSACAAQFQSPNGNYAADAMASWLAHVLSGMVTNPEGFGWYDRYGLENSEKCEGTYGTTYPVTNILAQSAQANIHLGGRDYLLQQNWVNGKKGHCAMSVSQ
jgi:hypothetical protein